MYIKLASIIEILLGLVMGGIGGFLIRAGSSSLAMGFPEIIGFFIFGVPMILFGIFLIIFGRNLWQLKKWAWLASIIILMIILMIVILLFIMTKSFFLLPLIISAIICLISLILGARQIFPGRETTESSQKIQIEKKISIPWKKILITAVLIAVGVMGYYLYRNLQRPVPPRTAPPAIGEPVIEDETADWKIYRNEYSYGTDYWGYEIKYPSDWIMTEYEGVHQAKWTSPRTMPPSLREIFIETLGALRHGGFSVDTINCTWSESQKEWFKKNPELESKTYPRPLGKEIIGPIQMEFCKMEDMGGDEIGKIGGLGITYVIYKNGWDYENTLWVYYDIYKDYQPSENEFQYELDIFNQMLSTFKFIKK